MGIGRSKRLLAVIFTFSYLAIDTLDQGRRTSSRKKERSLSDRAPHTAKKRRAAPAGMPSPRPILLVAAMVLWSAACVAAQDTFLPPAPPGAASPFPFCPSRPVGLSTKPFPWSTPTQTPMAPATVFPQDPGYFPSEASPVSRGGAWLPLPSLLSAFIILLL